MKSIKIKNAKQNSQTTIDQFDMYITVNYVYRGRPFFDEIIFYNFIQNQQNQKSMLNSHKLTVTEQKILFLDKFIMYDNLQQAINHRRFLPIPRPFPTTRFHDLNGVEPWQKNTLEILVEDPIRQVKTFYNEQRKASTNKYHTTLRGFSFRTERAIEPITKTKSVAATSRKSAISHYNINGNILGELTHTPKSLPFQLPCKPIRTVRHREKTANAKASEYTQSTLKGFQNLMEIKRKINIQRQKSNKGFVHLNSQPDQQKQNVGNFRRKSKVITLGFHKLSINKGGRQKSSKSKVAQQTF